ncbi:MAG: hypothetical protein K0S33_2363 [Bacteroidetes bacterium]|jgi:hypothetical protein|nr:hypothetical protein [Bacteroidota bacterium]
MGLITCLLNCRNSWETGRERVLPLIECIVFRFEIIVNLRTELEIRGEENNVCVKKDV